MLRRRKARSTCTLLPAICAVPGSRKGGGGGSVDWGCEAQAGRIVLRAGRITGGNAGNRSLAATSSCTSASCFPADTQPAPQHRALLSTHRGPAAAQTPAPPAPPPPERSWSRGRPASGQTCRAAPRTTRSCPACGAGGRAEQGRLAACMARLAGLLRWFCVLKTRPGADPAVGSKGTRPPAHHQLQLRRVPPSPAAPPPAGVS